MRSSVTKRKSKVSYRKIEACIDPADTEFKETIGTHTQKVTSSDVSSNTLQDQGKNVQGNLSYS